MLNYKIILFSLIFCIGQSIFSQSNFNENYQDGQLFVQTRAGLIVDFKESLFKDKKLEPFKIKSIERAFKLNTSGLDRVYLIKFNNSTITNEFIQLLKATNYFTYVEKVPLYTFDYTPNDLQSSQWHLPKIMAENAWSIQKGSSKIIIGLVDDALDTAHTDIEPIVWRNTAEIRGNNIDDDGNGYIDDYIGWDVADNDNDPTGGNSLSHGTHCGGIAAAHTDNNNGIASIGFGCKLMAVKTGQTGSNYLANPYAGIEYCIINKANVISMSWGGGGYSSTYQLLFDDAFSKGIVCVAAAGNSNTNFTHYPSGYNYVIAVGSTTSSDAKSSFSNYGTWVDVMAPGSSIYSTLPNNTYGNYSGTSMACPLVSGLCALMLSKNPNATPTEIENCLKSSCDNIDNVNSNYIGEIGAGRINAEKSLKCLKPINALFTSNFKQVCPGDTIQFTDLSKPTPVSLKWLFPGGSPSSTFISKPKIRYATAGVYDVTLIAFGNSVSDTLILKKYITVAKPKATLSLNRTIPFGGSTTIKLDFTGNAPYSFKISDGSIITTVSNILYTPYYYAVSPTQTTTYTLTSFNDSKCVGAFSGSSKVTVNTSTNCLNAIKYQAYIGGSSDDIAYTVTEDPNGNILVSGTTKNYGNGDIFLSKINKDGTIIWFKTYGGSGNDIAYKHIITKDGGYLLTGTSNSYASNEDGILIKTDTSGTVLWSKTIGGSSREYFQRMVELDNGSVLIGGGSNSYGAGDLDNYLIKIAQNGNLVWAKTYGNSDYNVLTGITSFADGSIIFSSSYRDGSGDLVIAKTDSLGNLIWSKKCNGSNNDAAYDLVKGNDGNVYTIGAYRTNSDQDICVASFTPNGTLRFVKSYAGSGEDAAYDVKNIDNDILVTGYTTSFGKGGYDGFLLKIDTAGNTMSSKVYGGTTDDLFFSSCISKDGGIYAVGYSKSFTNGGQDIFVNKANCKLEIGCNEGNFSPNNSNVSSISTITQSVSNGGSFTNQSISATSRNLKLNYKCITLASSSAPCLKFDKYTKISSTTSGFSGQLDNDDHFGQSINNLGDFDGDGVDDIIVGSMFDDDGGSNTGAVFLIFLNSDGTIKGKQKISPSSGGFTGNLSGTNYFGSGVSSLKDIDNDGINDIVVGQNFDNTGNAQAGAVWILLMNSNGTVKSHQKIANSTGGFPSILGNYDLFGNDVQEAGDLDNDGITDIMVGAPYDDDGGTDRGAFYFLYLNSNGTVKSYTKISSTSSNFTTSLNNGDNFGYSLSELKDINQDGYIDLVVGARTTDVTNTDAGAAWILSFDGNQNIVSNVKISNGLANFTGTLDASDLFGSGVSTIKDLDKDGNDEILVSAPYDDDGGTDRGAGWLLYMNKNLSVKSHRKISSTSTPILKNLIDNSDVMGWRLAAINDIDNNGFDEIVIGSMYDDDGGTDRGAVYILNLADTCSSSICPKVENLSKLSDNTGGFGSGLDDIDKFGAGVNGIGDIDKDGIPDMAVCASADDDGVSDGGAIWILFMNTNGTIRAKQKISTTQGGFTGSIGSGTIFGIRIIPLGDLNNDGTNDIAVSHHFDGTIATRAGCIWILFLNTNGTVKSHQKITTGIGGFTPTLQTDDRFGVGLENIGDFDNDGVIDIAVGAQEDKDGGSAKGAFYILMMNTNGTVKSHKKISATQGGFKGTIGTNTRFGFGITKLSDLNNDGVTDIAVCSRDDNDGGTARGALWILFMNANGTVKSHVKLSSTFNNFSGLDDYDNLGNDMRNVGDYDNDGIDEIAISCPWDDDGGSDRGAIWILYLRSNGKIKNKIKINSTNSKLSGKIDNSDLFGYGVGVIGDLNKDGYNEILSGAMWDDDGGTDRGAVYIMNYKDTCSTPIKPNICKLFPKFTNSLGCILDSVEFIDLSTDSFKNSIVQWHWDFGDGNTLKGTPNPKHLYNSIGTYNVKLIVSNSADNTCKDSITKQIKIENKFFLSPSLSDTICINDTASVGVGVIFCGTEPYSFQWSPANLAQNPSSNLTKVFPTKTTNFTVIVTDKFGQKAYDTVLVVIDSNCCKSFAHFNTNKTQYCFGDTAFITNQSKAMPGAIFEWKITPSTSYSNYTGTTAPPIILSKSGIYTIQLIVQDICGNDTTIKQIYVLPQPTVYAGRDTALCFNDSVQIGDITIGRNAYQWNPNIGLSNPLISNPKAYFTSNIQYTLTMEDEQGCKATDTINITKIIEPKLNIGNDTMLCVQDSVLLKSNLTATNYLWHNGSTQPSIYGKNSGLYWLSVKTKCIQSDSITLTFIQAPKFSLGNDTIVCNSNILQIKPNINTSGLGLLWDNNTSNTSRNATTKGIYWLKISNYKCESIDSIFVEFSKTPFVNLGNDTILCNNESLSLNATDNNAKSYLWNDGSKLPTKTINVKGKYTVLLKNNCGNFIDEITIETLNSAIPFLRNDTTICIGDTIVLNAFSPHTTFYKWNDNSNLATLKVSNAGKYSVQTGNKCGTFDTSVNISTKSCDCNIYLPNVFSPNHSENLNDIFSPKLNLDCMPTYYKLQIFDRWGEELFTSSQITDGWNGKYKEKLVANGVYVWILTLQHPYMNKNEIFKKTGSVLIIE